MSPSPQGQPQQQLDPFALSWSAPEGCPTKAQVEDAIASQLPDALTTRRLEIAARVEAADTGWRLQLRIAEEERVLEGATCVEVVDAMALLVGLALAEGAEPAPTVRYVVRKSSPRAVATEGDDVPMVTRSSEVGATPQPEPEPGPPRRRDLSLGVALGSGVAVGTLPATAWAAGLSVGLGGRKWGVDVGLLASPIRRASAPGRDDLGGEYSRWSVRGRGCGVPTKARVEFPMCLGVAAGAIRGKGTGDLQSRTAVAPMVDVLASPGLRVRATDRVVVFVAAEGSVSVLRPRLAIDDVGQTCCGRYGLAAVAGVEIRAQITQGRGSTGSTAWRQ